MFKSFFCTFFLLFGSFITIYPSQKEDTNLFNYCYSLEKIISRNSVDPGTFKSIFYEKSKQKINDYKDIKKEVDAFINDINFQYKSIKKEINDFL